MAQPKFISALEPGRRLSGETSLADQERQDFKSMTGSLQWLAGQTRPDIASVVSLSSKGPRTTVEDLKNVIDTIDFVRSTPQHGIVLEPVPINPGTVIAVFGDSGWANAEQTRSQHGAVIVITSPTVTEQVAPCGIIDWKTSRSPQNHAVGRSKCSRHGSGQRRDGECFTF